MSRDYAIYLRKSRADLEAEARGEGETLARHRAALHQLADRRGLNVIREYAEIATGDSIAARPQMQALLDDVKKGTYAGVIVNDIDRLGRGDSIDQEIIKYTFVAGGCIIITPGRDINPAAPSDEDMLDFSMFFARFEYRKIKQRLTQGRARSAASGNYLTGRVPMGYKKVHDGKNIRLVPDPETQDIVKMVFDWYASGKMGYKAIAGRLNEMGIKTSLGNSFDRHTIRNMLSNPAYVGNTAYGRHVTISTIENGRRIKKQVSATPTTIENTHPGIVPLETFEKVQVMFRESQHATPKPSKLTLANPLAGLLFCSKCGRAMQLRGGREKRTIVCLNKDCPTRGIYVYDVVDAILDTLQSWCAEYKDMDAASNIQVDDTERIVRRQMETIQSQIAKAQELVELGVYTPSEFIERRKNLNTRLATLEDQLKAKAATPTVVSAILPEIRRVLDAWPYASTPEEQNNLLKTIIDRIEYNKTQVATKAIVPATLMDLVIYPKIGNNVETITDNYTYVIPYKK